MVNEQFIMNNEGADNHYALLIEQCSLLFLKKEHIGSVSAVGDYPAREAVASRASFCDS